LKHLARYSSPLGSMILQETDGSLSGAWFEGQKYFPLNLQGDYIFSPLLNSAALWLDAYFNGQKPQPFAPLQPEGSPFQRLIWRKLLLIPYGSVTTYGMLAASAAEELGLPRMSAQAAGGAVGRNPISVFIPCHRVIGANGFLTGYAGGLDKKEALLTLERADLRHPFHR